LHENKKTPKICAPNSREMVAGGGKWKGSLEHRTCAIVASRDFVALLRSAEASEERERSQHHQRTHMIRDFLFSSSPSTTMLCFFRKIEGKFCDFLARFGGKFSAELWGHSSNHSKFACRDNKDTEKSQNS
jgi:hypothetical protein